MPFTVLHLEDSEIDALMVASLLREQWPDCLIKRVASRAEFESALQFEDFDLILSDHQLPGYDGLRALELTRSQRPEKPFVFLSGTIGEERAVDAMKQGADDYVIKDRPARLVPAVRQVLARVAEVTRRRVAEEALRQNQERFRQIAENVADMIAVLDLSGVRIYNNPAYRNVLGDPEALRGTDSFVEIHPDDRERVRAVFAETVRTGIGRRINYRFLLPGGAVRYIESQGSVIRRADGQIANVLVVSRDETERRAAELQLQEQASLLDKARDAIITTDLEHRIAYWNASAERIYGWKAAEVYGRDLRELGLGIDPARFATARSEVLAKGEWRGHFRLQSRRGTQVHIASTWSLVVDPSGAPRTLLLIDTDLTEEKKLEAQLLRAQRLESIGTLTAGITHDLNNALAPILMGAELLQAQDLSPAAVQMVRGIETGAQHGAALVRQLLGFARGTEGERAGLNTNVFVEEVGTLLRQTLPSRIKLETVFAPDLAPLQADATQLKQVVLNLCINACDAMPDGGRITFSARNVVVDDTLARRVPDGSPGPHLLLQVADTGTGIPADILDRIFDPFFTTKEVGKGTGLGLSMVRGIVKGHGGFLHVESTVNAGTTFHIYLPVAETPAAVAAGAAAPKGHGETILVINDVSGVRDMLQPFLEHHQYRVITAGDGREGLERFRAQAADIAAVVLEAMMSGESSSAVIAGLREQNPRLPLVVIVGPGAGLAPEQLTATTATVTKPVEPRHLLAALERVLAAVGRNP
jgi:PAS domain S-box-containing protein